MALIAYDKDYNVYFNNIKNLKAYDYEYKDEITNIIDDLTYGKERPWHTNWRADPVLKPKFSILDNKFYLYVDRKNIGEGDYEYYQYENEDGIFMPLEIIL